MKKFTLKPWHAILGLVFTEALNYFNRNWAFYWENDVWSYLHDLISYLYGIFTIMFLYLVIRNLFRWLKEIIVGRSQLPPSTPPHHVGQQSHHHQE